MKADGGVFHTTPPLYVKIFPVFFSCQKYFFQLDDFR